MLNGVHLFAGYGGADDALAGYVRPVLYCEIEQGSQRILMHRMRKGEIGRAPIWDDVRSLSARQIAGRVNILTAGWPCKQISIAGNRQGIEGPDSKLFFEVARLARELEPEFLFLENSPNLFCDDMGFDRVAGELAEQGFFAEWGVLSAFDVGAPHYRDRAWILASHPDRIGRWLQPECIAGSEGPTFAQHAGTRLDTSDANREREPQPQGSEPDQRGWLGNGNRQTVFHLAHAHGERLERRADSWKAWKEFALGGGGGGGSWPSGIPLPTLRELDDGTVGGFSRSDRRIGVAAGGNGWVPQTAREAFLRLSGLGG